MSCQLFLSFTLSIAVIIIHIITHITASILLRLHRFFPMAFNKPVDADRVDDLGLLSSILRAPIIGPVFWMLGKLTTKQQQDELDSAVCRTVPRESLATENVSSLDSHVIDSITSRLTDRIGILSDEIQRTNTLRETSPSCSELFQKDLHPPLKKTRKTSWSDESGHSLAKYCDEVSESKLKNWRKDSIRLRWERGTHVHT